ncbi:MAG TPA: CopD family protein, partial [Dongiaceae bacterium]|nr:CopD family protein [Dongiaceae bacterium]
MLAGYYDWIKAAHIFFVIAWMAGMLYLPRLYVYHARAAKGSELSETFKVMERRLMRGIINPSMGLTWILGLTLAWLGNHWSEHWLHGKLLLVLCMQLVHAGYSRWRKQFARDENRHTEK